MIELNDGWLTWDAIDSGVMFSIVGEGAIEKGQTRFNPSILLAAHKKGIPLSTKCSLQLEQARLDHAFLRQARRRKDARVPNYPLQDKMFTHQRVALSFMEAGARPGYLLADSPGVGKTAVAIAWADLISAVRIMVITPNSAKYQWRREIRRFDSDRKRRRRVQIVDGTLKEQIATIHSTIDDGGWCVGHWQSLSNARFDKQMNWWFDEVGQAYLETTWDLIILDEAHALRNRKTIQYDIVSKLEAKYRLALTGHPYVNDPTELYGILAFLYPERYTSFWRYADQHIAMLPRHFGGYDVIGLKNPKLLRWEIGPFTIRRTKQQVFKDLPPITRTPREVDLPPAHRKEYQRLQNDLIVELEGVNDQVSVLTLPNVLARVTRLRQYVVDPGMLGGRKKSVKYPVVAELLEELDKPPVIFTSFRKAAFGLQEFLGEGYAVIRGGQKTKDRERIRKNFLKRKYKGLIVVTQAGGTALNYGKYGYVIFLDLPWSAMELEQAEGRVDRPEEGTGKLVPTTSHIITVRGTYETNMGELVMNKATMFTQLFAGEIPRLSRTELLEVLSDSDA